jgi:hypothetical protein
MATTDNFDWSTIDEDAAEPGPRRAGAELGGKQVCEFLGQGATGGVFVSLPITVLFGGPFVGNAVVCAVLFAVAWTLVSAGLRSRQRARRDPGFFLPLLACLLGTACVLSVVFAIGLKIHLNDRARNSPPAPYIPPAQIH